MHVQRSIIRRPARGALVLAAALALPAVPTAAGAQVADFQWRGPIAEGQTLEVKGINGRIHARAASGDEVELRAVKRTGRRGDPADVRVEVVRHDDGVTICAVYPEGEDGRPNVCAPSPGGHLGNGRSDVSVHFEVAVPAGVRFAGSTVNGDVEIDRLRGDARATTVNGDVRIGTDGIAEATTVNGSIAARLGRATWRQPLEFRTVNGGITVELPGDAGAEVRAETLNGGIRTDFPLTVSGRFNSRRLAGTINGGGPELRLATVNGSIRLRRGN